jgi:hypothetical protein
LRLNETGVDGRTVLTGDLVLLKNHSRVQDFEAQGLPLSVSSEIIVNDYKFTDIEGQEDIFTALEFDLVGLAVVSYPRSASSIDTLKPIKENTMAKKELKNDFLDEAKDLVDKVVGDEGTVVETPVEATETPVEGVEVAETSETSTSVEEAPVEAVEAPQVDNSVTIAVQNAIEELKTVRIELNNAVVRADKAESLNNELKAQIAEIENSVKTLIGNATVEQREAPKENQFNVLNTSVGDYK